MRGRAARRGGADRAMGERLDRGGQRACISGRRAAERGRCDGEHGREPGTGRRGPQRPPPGRRPASVGPESRGGGAGECSPRSCLPGEITRVGRDGETGEQFGDYVRRPWGIRGQMPAGQHGIQNLLVQLRGSPAGNWYLWHLAEGSARPAQSVTPALSTRPASRRSPRCAATRTAPGDLPTILATSWVSRSATTRSRMISA
jgi:hypothetical protein